MKFWKNTSTLDQLENVHGINDTVDPHLAEIAVIGSKPIDLDELPKLKGIFKCGVGVDNVPFEDAKKRSIKICLPSEKTKRIIFEETANFTIYLIMRMIYDRNGDFESWQKRSREYLGKLKVLVIGQGNIGKIVKNKMELFTEVTTFDVSTNQMNDLEGYISTADIITLHIPLNSETKSFIDREKLSWIKNDAALINTSRGPIVDEDALFDEINSGRIRAAFDVFWNEPYKGKLTCFEPNQFLMTPHVSSTCKDFIEGLGHDLQDFVVKLTSSQN